MYKCKNCGHVFEEGEQATWIEEHGFSSGPFEEWSGCPICSGGYEETKQCKICGEEFLEEELKGGCICDDCIDNYKNDFDTCYKIADTEKEEIKINALLASLVSVSKIEAILYHVLKEKGDVDSSAFINQDKDWFAEKLVERYKND